jgi:hypothetical protein
MINQTFSLMFKDAYGYLSVNPAKWGTTYSIYNETSDVVTVRGGSGTNDDIISVTRSGNIVSVSVDPLVDVPGTGNLPGAGNLDAWVTEYDITTQPITSLTIDSAAGNDTIMIGSNVGVPINLTPGTGTDSLTVVGTTAAETITVTSTAQMTSGTTTINITGGVESTTITATAQFNSTMNLGALSIGAGGVANMPANGNRVLVTNALSINPTGKLDLFDNDMIVEYSGGTPFTTIRNLLNQGRNNGAWNGNGITSTTAGANPADNTTQGILEGSDYDGIYGAGASFSGQSPDATSILIKYTYYGDADYNGSVDFDDYVRTDAGFNTGGTTWVLGDFNGNGSVDFDDFVLLDLGFNTQGALL